MANGLLCNWGIIRGNWQVAVDNSGKNQFTLKIWEPCEYIYYIFWHINHSKTSLQNTVFILMPSCGKGSPHLPTLLNHMFWIEHVVRAGRLQQEKRQKREGRRRQRSRVGGGVSAIAACALKRDESSGGTPPPVRWTSLPACLPPPLLSSPVSVSGFFRPLLFLGSSPLFISMLTVPSTQLQLLLQPIYRAPSSSLHLPSIRSWTWRLRAGLILLLSWRATLH